MAERYGLVARNQLPGASVQFPKRDGMLFKKLEQIGYSTKCRFDGVPLGDVIRNLTTKCANAIRRSMVSIHHQQLAGRAAAGLRLIPIRAANPD
jgi:hypothetical protein